MSESTEPTAAEALSTPAALPGRARLRRTLFIAGPAAAGVMLLGAWLLGGRSIDTDDAYVKANKVNVSAEVTGIVAEVRVKENDPVHRGQVLMVLDAAPFKVAVQQAEAQLAQTRLEVQSLRATYGQKGAALASAAADLAYQRTRDRRVQTLHAGGIVSQADVDEANHSLQVAETHVQELQHDLQQAAAQLNGDAKAAIEVHPSYRVAAAALEKAKLDLARTEIRAPMDGVASKVPDPGTYAMPGLPVMSLVGEEESWIEANFKESELERIRIGAPVAVTVDAYPSERWQGTVESIGQATGAEFSLLPAQNASGNWVKVVQRIPVRVRLAHRQDEPPLRAGMSAGIEVAVAQSQQGLGRWLAALGLGSAEAREVR